MLEEFYNYEKFYNYVVKQLILEYFKKVSNKPGDRYYFIMDEKAVNGEDAQSAFNKAIESISEEIIISGIYVNGQSNIKEEEYKTRVIRLPAPLAPVIIGNDITATEDYLVTMRNSIGEVGGQYEHYSSLFILSDKPYNSSNPLSSICTSCVDLKSPGKPLSVDYVINNIKSHEKDIYRDHERLYFKVYLEKMEARIGDGSSSIYDLMPALSVLENKSIEGLFDKLGFFPDQVVLDVKNKLRDKDVEDRARTNYMKYQQIINIMDRDDDIDKTEELMKVLDEQLSKRIAKSDNWKSIDYQEIESSIEKRNSSDNLEFIGISLKEESPHSSLIYRQANSRNRKKTVTYALVCGSSEISPLQIVAKFNKSVKHKYLNKDSRLEVYGNKVYITVPNSFSTKNIIGKNDNHHDFYVLTIPCEQDFFDKIKNIFTIDEKGRLVITVPSDKGAISFGSGEIKEFISKGKTMVYSSEKCFWLNINPNSDENYSIEFKFNFHGKDIYVIVKVKVDLKSGLDPLNNPDKRDRYCRWEDYFCAKRATSFKVSLNSLTQEEKIEEQIDVPLDDDVSKTLELIYEYYSSRNAGPTLLPLTREVKKLFENYLSSVFKSLSKIKDCEELEPAQYALTKLGIVEYDNRIYLSPFNPLMVAYILEYERQRDDIEEDLRASELLSPFYLVPFISYNNIRMRPCVDDGLKLKKYKNWLCYEKCATNKPQDRAQDITTRMVCDRMQEFIKHFNYLFQDLDCPIVISTIGIEDDRNVIKGILRFIINTYKEGVRKIEIHEYVPNLMSETFLEKLNRLVSPDLVERELESLGVKLEKKGEYTSLEIIRLLFTKVVLYKHLLCDQIDYCHIAFYQMDTGSEFIYCSMKKMRSELALNGLVSIPSTMNNGGKYYIGFGCDGVEEETASDLYRMAKLLSNLYANEDHRGANSYRFDIGIVKMHEFNKQELLNSIYNNANWVTFLNPEVDIDFFYKQDLYIIQYTDQYSINAKYDSITITKHTYQYDNMLKQSYEHYGLSIDCFENFNKKMKKYFNCLNGNWLLNIINKTESQINEKMSLVATSIIMQHFMKRVVDVIWVPVSLEEILRVTGAIGLPKHYICTKEDLGIKGVMSDDLLMIGLDTSNCEELGMYIYPIEVKLSNNSEKSIVDKGREQVCKTYKAMRDHLLGDDTFMKKIFRTFFASQFLVNAEKLHSNELMSDDIYETIEKYRYRLLNLKYKLFATLPIKEMGHAALVLFHNEDLHRIRTLPTNEVNVCEIHFPKKECYKIVASSDDNDVKFLTYASIESNIIDEVSNEEVDSVSLDDENMPQPGGSEGIEVIDPLELNSLDKDLTVLPVERGMKITLGTEMESQHKIVFEPNNTKMVSHPNMGIIGTMGTGKTQFARSLITQLAQESHHNVEAKPVGILVFDYKGDYKDSEFLTATNGEAYKSKFPFNPLKLIVTPDLEGVNLPAVTADKLSDSFAKAYGLGAKQQGKIKQVIIETYADYGITRDPSTWHRQIPTMENVIEKYFATYDANDKAYILFDKFRDYTIFTTDENACVSIFEWLDRVRVIDLTLYPDDTKKVIVSLILDLFYAEMKQLGESKQIDGYRQLRSFIMVDEAHQFLKKDFSSLRSIISEGRMFGVGMILSTQSLGDFRTNSENYSTFILSWIIHHVNSISKSEIASIFGNDTRIDCYLDRIKNAQLFESVCKIGSSVYMIRDLPFFKLIEGGI